MAYIRVYLCLLQIALVVLTVTDGRTVQRREAVSQEGRCSQCSPGYGVKALCNGVHDTICVPCPPGTFSADYSIDKPCSTCSFCTEGHYERTPCISTQDVVCMHCYENGGGYGNEDFLRKCETTSTSTTTVSTTTTTTISTVTTSTNAPTTSTTTTSTSSPTTPLTPSPTKPIIDQGGLSPREENRTKPIIDNGGLLPRNNTIEDPGSGDIDDSSGEIGSGEVDIVIPKVVDNKLPPGKSTLPPTTEHFTEESFIPIKPTKRPRNTAPLQPWEKDDRKGKKGSLLGFDDKPEEAAEPRPAEVLFGDSPMVGASEEEEEPVEHGSFQWPILLAAVAGGLVFFVIGVIVSTMVRRYQQYSPNASAAEEDAEPVQTTLIEKKSDAAPSYKDEDHH